MGQSKNKFEELKKIHPKDQTKGFSLRKRKDVLVMKRFTSIF